MITDSGAARLLTSATYDRQVSVTPIRLLGDPVLRTPAAPVVDFDAELRHLVADLTDTMLEAGGAGLAAPQIGIGLRVFTWFVDGELGHLVNPDVAPVGEETEEGPEGCLSIPGFRFDCRRHLHVVATGWNVHGDPVRVEGSQLLARAVQHETDHLDGVLFVDRLDPGARAAALAEIADAEWAGMDRYTPVVRVSPH
jgi:peptide deformylase